MSSRPRIGVSACLLGQNVRFDGGHRHDDLVERLGSFVDLVPVCPEMALGLGAPRESMRLERDADGLVRLRTRKSRRDLAEPMRELAARWSEHTSDGLDGFIGQKGSPSCGVERVRVYPGEGRKEGPAERVGRGLFIEALAARAPLLPIEDEGRLCNPVLRDRFLVRIFTHHRLRALDLVGWRASSVVALHAQLKLLLLAHSPAGYRALGQLVAQAGLLPRDQLRERYRAGVMEALAQADEPGRHVNVLEHMIGYFRDSSSPEERRELAEVIAEYKSGLLPRCAPLTLMRHHVRRAGAPWLSAQLYFDPYPRELQPSFAV